MVYCVEVTLNPSEFVSRMSSKVSALGHKLKIVRSIIVFFTVLMMYDFIRKKKPSNNLFHNKPMFKNISLTIRKYVVFFKNLNIPFAKSSASLPKMVFYSGRSLPHINPVAFWGTKVSWVPLYDTWKLGEFFFADEAFNYWHVQTISNEKAKVNE